MTWPLTRAQTACLMAAAALLIWIGWHGRETRQAGGTAPDCSLSAVAPMQKAAFENALKNFEAILRRDPESVSGLVGRGTAYLALGNADRAVSDLDRAAQLSPRDAAIQCHLGAAYLARGEPEWALTYADSAIALAAENAGAHLVRGGSLRQLGRLEDSLAAFDRAIALAPGNLRAYVRRGEVNFQLRRYDRAVADITSILEQDRSPGMLGRRCWYRGVWGRQLREALADCDAAVAMEDGNAGLRDVRGLVRYRLGDYRGAVADLDAALKSSPDLETSLYVRGLAKRRLGDTSGGDRDIGAAQDRNARVAQDFAELGVTP